MKTMWYKLITERPEPRLLAIIGGGGKTSLLYYLLKIFTEQRMQAVAATTTKLCRQQKYNQFTIIENVEMGCCAVQQHKGQEDNNYLTLITGQDPQQENKVLGLPPEWLDELAAENKGVMFVVEGDGSAGKSLKGHYDYEPVIPVSSNIVIVVLGIDAVGKVLTSEHVHHPERIEMFGVAAAGSFITTDVIVDVLFHRNGYLHNCPATSMIIPFINKVETVLQYQQANDLATKILAVKHCQIPGVMLGSLITEEGQWRSQLS